MTPTPPSSVLAYVGFDRIGDGLLKLPFVRGLRTAFPDARITWLAGRETSVYADLMSGAVEGLLDEIIENGGVGLSPWELLKGHAKGPLAGRRFDLIIDTQRIFWTSLSVKRIPHGVFISPAARFLLSSRKPGPTAPWTVGDVAVRIDAMEARVQEVGAKAFSKSVPDFAKASMAGVCTWVFPYAPRPSGRRVSMM